MLKRNENNTTTAENIMFLIKKNFKFLIISIMMTTIITILVIMIIMAICGQAYSQQQQQQHHHNHRQQQQQLQASDQQQHSITVKNNSDYHPQNESLSSLLWPLSMTNSLSTESIMLINNETTSILLLDKLSSTKTTKAKSSTTTERQNNEEYFSYNVQIIWSLIFGIMITIGLLANLLVMATIGGHKSLHTVTNCFLLNLTVSDLVTLLFNAIFNFVFMITGNWPFGNRYCIVNNFITNLTIAISVFTIMFTSKERYNAIVHPLEKRMTQHRALVHILIIWIASAIFAIPALIFSRTLRDTSIQRTVCLIVWPDGYPGKSRLDFFYNLLFLVLTYLLPLMTMAIAYTLMARVLWGSKQIGETTQAQASLVRSKQKVVRMLICVVIVFAVCWLPYHVYFLTTYQWPELTTWPGIQHIFLAIYWLAMFNSVLNPIILLLMNKRFRRYSTKFLNFWPLNRAFNAETTSTQTTTAVAAAAAAAAGTAGTGANTQQQSTNINNNGIAV
ncbi:tachykinin-like peptides receptor 86C [Dermatophagoides pteronyssinus]|uniref:tachykinin-like peptides receptor 86C n=1 Tax=Dermatophagoides pteronyssinus TaxID=6956 RepID=UPI003F670406